MKSPSKFPCQPHHSLEVNKRLFRREKVFRAWGNEVTNGGGEALTIIK